MPKALVVGGGVAGPATAALLTARGWEAPVLEARPTPLAYEGLFLNVAINGRRVLRALGLEDRLLSAAHPAPEMVMWGHGGRRLGTVPNGPAGRPTDGGVIVRRGWLNQVLSEGAIGAGVDVRYGWELTSIDERADGVTAHFADGRTEDADIVIGADGLGSRVRAAIAPDVRPEFTGLLGTGGYARVPGLVPTPGVQHFVFGARSFFGYFTSDDGETYWFANLTATTPGERSVDGTEVLSRLRALHADDPSPVPQILEQVTGAVGTYPIFRLPPVPSWSLGRAVLVGDAVHATSPSAGQGASLALEDAAVLADCLAAHEGRPGDAFAAYASERRARVERVVAYAAAIDKQKRVTRSRLGIAIRDAVLPHFLRRMAADTRQDWVFDYTPPGIGVGQLPRG